MIRLSRPRLRREQDTRLRVVGAVLGVLAMLVAIVALAVHRIDWSTKPLIVLAAFGFWLMAAAPVAVVLLALARRPLATLAAVVVLAVCVAVQAPLYVGADDNATGRQLTVLQANVRIGGADPTDLVRTVRDRHVDVLMTEELTTGLRDRMIAAGISRLLPYRYIVTIAIGGVGIWSRYPLTDKQNRSGYALGVLSATAQVSTTRSVDLLAVHLLPPYPYPSAEWTREIARLRPLLAGTAAGGRPVLVAGDFNATTDNAQFRALLGDGYQDAAEHSGAGYLPSYPTDRWFPPVIAIDHVLTRGLPALDAATVDLPGSDHRGLLVHLSRGRSSG